MHKNQSVIIIQELYLEEKILENRKDSRKDDWLSIAVGRC